MYSTKYSTNLWIRCFYYTFCHNSTGSNPAVSAVTKPGRITGRWFYRVFLCHSFSKTTPFFRKKYLFFGKVFHEVFHEIHLQHFTNYYQSMDIWITCIPAWISYGQSIDKSWKSKNTFPTIYQPLFPQASPHFHIKQVPHIPTLSMISANLILPLTICYTLFPI